MHNEWKEDPRVKPLHKSLELVIVTVIKYSLQDKASNKDCILRRASLRKTSLLKLSITAQHKFEKIHLNI